MNELDKYIFGASLSKTSTLDFISKPLVDLKIDLDKLMRDLDGELDRKEENDSK